MASKEEKFPNSCQSILKSQYNIDIKTWKAAQKIKSNSHWYKHFKQIIRIWNSVEH